MDLLAEFPPSREVAEMREALAAVVAAWQRWGDDPAFPRPLPYREAPRGLKLAASHEAAIRAAVDALEALPDDAAPPAVSRAVGPVLGEYWPDYPAPAAGVAAAVERLRYVAMTRRSLIAAAQWKRYE
jgi:hypothetical protein